MINVIKTLFFILKIYCFQIYNLISYSLIKLTFTSIRANRRTKAKGTNILNIGNLFGWYGFLSRKDTSEIKQQ